MSEDRDKNKFNLRLPDGMRGRIAEEAKANNRSMNSEIVARLQTTFQMDDYVPSENAQPDDAVGHMMQTNQELLDLVKQQNELISKMLERMPDAS